VDLVEVVVVDHQQEQEMMELLTQVGAVVEHHMHLLLFQSLVDLVLL
jgi:hypothetical protein